MTLKAFHHNIKLGNSAKNEKVVSVHSRVNVSYILRGARGIMVMVVGNGHEFKSWTRLVAFDIALIPLGKI